MSKVRRKRGKWGGAAKVAAGIMGILAMVLVFWNPRGLTSKATEFKSFMGEAGAAYGGLSETHTYKEGKALSDGRYRWDAGTEGKPAECGNGPKQGMGAMIDTTLVEASLVRTDKYIVWHRLETAELEGKGSIVVGTGYFPQANDVHGHEEANRELALSIAFFREQGCRVIFGGDLNAHTGANGDTTAPDTAGRKLLDTVYYSDMILINTMPGLCSGGPTRIQVREDGTQQSTLDYIMCTPDLAPMVKSLVIKEGTMGSDHRPLILTLEGCTLKHPPNKTNMREVWRIDKIPSVPDDWSWVSACQGRFGDWLKHTENYIRATTAAGVGSSEIANILDWSFQHALEEVAHEHIGTKLVGPKATPVLNYAQRMAIQQRDLMETMLKRAMQDPISSDQMLREARNRSLAASRQVTSAAKRRNEIEELKLFRDVEANQGQSKLFWDKFKLVRSSLCVSKSPPPVAVDVNGNTVTEPWAVLRAWRDFSAGIASADLKNSREEGRYDDDYQTEVEDRLTWLRLVREHQPVLDKPITAKEVFYALRKLRMGSAPGEDGMLVDLLKTAADAVNNNKLRGENTVVDSLVVFFNFVFENEVWPDRWGEGVIIPLHKHDSRLDPANYRPITLLAVIGKLFGSVVNARLQEFSETTGSISDAQGGFRRNRSTTDQIFILREALASRKERGLPTYATYIDARKAYDTVWREQAYVRIYDSGVKGRLWRQLQVMHKNLTRKVLHPLGYTDSFSVDRGVAQGAVESPWVYSNFIDALGSELKAAGLGIWMAGLQIPILMYADDMVMLASNQAELKKMNAIATSFARRNRFEFNGEKSGVMQFNTAATERAQCLAEPWELFGERVKVKTKYEYLGTDTPADGMDWRNHFNGAIEKAKTRSADLLWVCRGDRGIRPRTAVTLWQSLVRPLLEYGSELWSGKITTKQAKDAERVQMTFLRGTLGLHENGSGVADDVVRAETGCECIRARWEKLQLGYWRRLFVAPTTRLLRQVATFRWNECRMNNRHFGTRGWMPTAKRTLVATGLQDYWDAPAEVRALDKASWQRKCYEAVDTKSDTEREARMRALPSTESYVDIKEWGANPKAYSFSSGEENKIGQLVPERYLDDRKDLKGTRLKLLCRSGCLPVMRRVGRERRPPWPKATRTCMMCNTGQVEDVEHFIMQCSGYNIHRAKMLADVRKTLDRTQSGLTSTGFDAMNQRDQKLILMGKRFDDPASEDRLDGTVKRFLRKAWTARAPLTKSVNAVLGTEYEVYTYRK
jgi:hypothetical protein